MLTFRFTGASGEMIEEEMLAAGMVGKQVRFQFSSDWDGLRKVAVYKAGTACCTSVDVGEVDTIPAEVLSKSLHRLFVGVYGISENGAVVTPAVFAPGPFIHISAVMGDDPCFDPKNTFWIKLEQALEETVRFTPQELTEEQQAQARENIGVGAASGGLSESAAAVLLTILKNGVYVTDQSDSIASLEALLRGEAVRYHSVTYGLTNVSADSGQQSVVSGASYTTVLTAEDGYTLESVTVTMGGKDITAQVYANGTVTIPAVTGNVVITASAVMVEEEETGGILYVAASVFDNQLNQYTYPSNRMSIVTTEVVADTPFPQSGTVYGGSLYLLPVPAGAKVLNVTSPGLIGGPQFFTLADGAYTCLLDAGWQTEGGFQYLFTPDTYDFVALNFKNSGNSAFFTEDYDTSGIAIEFEAGETTFGITLSLSHVSADNPQQSAASGESYTTVLSAEDGYTLGSVTVTMGGADVTASVYAGGKVSIPVVTGAVVITALAEREAAEEDDGILFVPASASASTIDLKDPPIRMCTVMLTGDTPFPQNGQVHAGNLYPIPVPAGAAVLKVTSPGLIGGVQFYTLANGVYTSALDTGWQTEGGFSYTFEADAYDHLIVNFKNSANSAFFTEDYDTSGISISFE